MTEGFKRGEKGILQWRLWRRCIKYSSAVRNLATTTSTDAWLKHQENNPISRTSPSIDRVQNDTNPKLIHFRLEMHRAITCPLFSRDKQGHRDNKEANHDLPWFKSNRVCEGSSRSLAILRRRPACISQGPWTQRRTSWTSERAHSRASQTVSECCCGSTWLNDAAFFGSSKSLKDRGAYKLPRGIRKSRPEGSIPSLDH
ncbi:hypothetical protein VNO77_18348 [Canavalia gladiata]|uniref:Uncharacterized protein n=1 Tax=Canavalia gladiata TaxID=3824 RepID=A0AAN9QK92_CANGL